MNRYFIRGEGRRDFPRRSYARIDQIEPTNLDEACEVLIAFDAVDARWPGFESGNLLSLEIDPEGERRLARFWKERFSENPPSKAPDVDPFDELPLYRIELTLPRDHPWTDRIIGAGGAWVEIQLDTTGQVEVDVFGGLFMEAVTARMAHLPKPTPKAAALDRVFDMSSWPDASRADLLNVLDRGCDIGQLIVFDVGQGSAVGLVCTCGFPRYYYDAGCGVYRNAKTNPASISFCVHDTPPVILSHWDSDHWAGAAADRDLLKMTWVAPRQSISQKHTAFANTILKAGGRLLIVPASLSPLSWGLHQHFELRRCTGKSSDRNESGLALIVEDRRSGRGWLLTGDAAYHLIPPPLPSDLAAVVAPHHGADMGPASVPPSRSANPYSRLLYSFGPGNAHGRTHVRHPTAAAVTAHTASAWPHPSWSPPPPGMAPPGHPVLATASHVSAHQNGAAAGWTAPPGAPRHLAGCPKAMPVTQS